MVSAGAIESWDLMAEVGNEFSGYMDSRNRVGAFYSAAPTYDELREKVQRANLAIDVIGSDGRSIKVGGLYLH